jgi:hypothetical protein
MVFLLHFAFKRTFIALCFFGNGPSGPGYFLSFAIRMSQPFDAKKEKGDTRMVSIAASDLHLPDELSYSFFNTMVHCTTHLFHLTPHVEYNASEPNVAGS